MGRREIRWPTIVLTGMFYASLKERVRGPADQINSSDKSNVGFE